MKHKKNEDQARKKVQVWIICPPLVLILKTVENRKGIWQTVTGKAKKGEALHVAALREAREETGLEFTQAIHDLDYSFTFIDAKERKVREYVYVLQVERSSEVTLSKEHQDYRWVSTTDALKIIHHESNRQTLQMVIEKYFRLFNH